MTSESCAAPAPTHIRRGRPKPVNAPLRVRSPSRRRPISRDSFIPQTREADITPFEPSTMMASFEGIGRGDKYEDYLDNSYALYSLSERFARRVAGSHNKNVIFLLVGEVGSGKSMALLSLADACAKWLAKLKGGTPEDYFTLEDNVAIIDPEMLSETMNNLKKHNIYILDDAGPGYDARSFMSNTNKDLGHIFQTCRTQNNIIMISAPHGAMLDVTIRRLAHFYGEVTEVRHDIGMSFIKVFRLKQSFRNNKILYQYPSKGVATITRFQALMPPKELADSYQKVRDEQALALQKSREEREAEAAAKKEKDKPPTRTELMWKQRVENDGQKLLEAIEKDPEISPSKLSMLVDYRYGAVVKVMNRMGWGYDPSNRVWHPRQ